MLTFRGIGRASAAGITQSAIGNSSREAGQNTVSASLISLGRFAMACG
jgi:hypothetical protein